jgi:replication factor A1
VYTFNKAYTKSFKDQVQINVGSRGSVDPAEGVNIDVASRPSAPAKTVSIGDITDKDGSVTVTGKILDISTRVVNVRGEDRTVWGGMIADSTGKIQFSAWEDYNLAADKVVTIENAYIRSWKGIPQLNIGNNSTVTESDENIEVKGGPAIRTVEEISRTGGLDITLTGIIVDVKGGSGLIKRCPECKRSIISGSCSVHGIVDSPISDLRLKTTLDDGTGSISVVIGRKDTEALSGITLEEAESSAKDAGDSSAISNRIAAKVLLKKVTVTGNVMTDEKFGPQMSVRTLQEVATDIQAEAEKLYAEIEEAMM